MLDKFYHAILWFTGFQQGEHVSDMLARQKLRLGKWWWFFPIITILGTLLLLVFEIWLIIHIITFELKKKD